MALAVVLRSSGTSSCFALRPPVSWRLPAGGATCDFFSLVHFVFDWIYSLSDGIDSNGSRVALFPLCRFNGNVN